jgi:hypothetical protein
MKTQRAVREVRDQIRRDAPHCRVTALIERDNGRMALAVLDTKSGEQFTISSCCDWTRYMDRLDWSEEREQAAR